MQDLEIIFSRFGKITSCDIIRDWKTGDSLCYAFLGFDNDKSAEEAFFKMNNVLIDDRRIKEGSTLPALRCKSFCYIQLGCGASGNSRLLHCLWPLLCFILFLVECCNAVLSLRHCPENESLTCW